MKQFVFSVVLFFCFQLLHASPDTAWISFLLKRIEQQQINDDKFFLKGSYPAYTDQYHRGYSERIKDINTSVHVVINTLEVVRKKLLPTQAAVIDSIRSRSLVAFKKFQNKDGKGSYNFWRQDTAYRFPYNWWVPFLIGDRWYIPDDLDDTVLCLMALNTDSANAVKIHNMMQNFSAYPAKKVVGCPKEYKSIPTYSTWFGKKFPVFFDVCVAANILTFVQKNNLQWTKADTATLQFLVKAIQSKDYINKYKDMSPYYKNKSIILYHFAKLMYTKKINELEKYKPELVTEALKLFEQSNNILEQMILCTVIQKLGYTAPIINLPAKEKLLLLVEHNDLAFFTGDMLGYFEGNVKKVLEFFFKKALYYNQYCPAYNDALLLEYLLLNNISYGS